MLRQRLPSFFKQEIPHGPQFQSVQGAIREHKLHTVCEEAKCPNRTHCYARGTLTFQILGDICTRSCGFCAEKFGRPSSPPDATEPQRVVAAAEKLKLSHVVITSPARDDLDDDGAGQFVAVINAFRERLPHVTVEILTPDMRGKPPALQMLFEARPDIFNHNIETVRRLTPKVRSKATYDRTLAVLGEASRYRVQGSKCLVPGNDVGHAPHTMRVKSGIMLGHGEEEHELLETFEDLRKAGVEMLTLGQYLPPSTHHLPLVRVYLPREFEALKEKALELGFLDVAAGPLVRSSYQADLSVQRLTRGSESMAIVPQA